MTVKQKLLLFWVFALVAIGFAAHHFLSGAFCAFQNIIAVEVGFASSFTKLGAIFFGTHF